MNQDTRDSLVIRADASSTIGAGHVMRCIAIAQAWQETGGSVTFVMSADSEPLHGRLTTENMHFVTVPCASASPEDVRFTNEVAAVSRALIVDGYHFSPEFRAGLASDDRALVIIDDCGDLGPYQGDLIVNPSWLDASPLYPGDGPTTLVGSRYSLLRREFRDHTPHVPRESANHVLVTLGGADPGGLTPRVLASLESIAPRLRISVIVGGTNQQASALEALADASHHHVQLAHDVTHMSEYMVAADVAISAGGGTCWELAHLGVPSIVIIVADNQRGVVRGLDRQGVMESLGWYQGLESGAISNAVMTLLEDPQRRRDMAHRGRELIDGRGPYRVTEAIRAL